MKDCDNWKLKISEMSLNNLRYSHIRNLDMNVGCNL